MKITIYTDGSSRGNPGPGGWAAILLENRKQKTDDRDIHEEDQVIELGGREDMTTNNRMELMGAIKGLQACSAQPVKLSQDISTKDEVFRTDELQATSYTLTAVEVCTDSEYVRKGMSSWIEGWVKKGWKTSTKKDVLNKDLWEALLKEETRLKSSGIAVVWKYVPGHAGVAGNERADEIATACADNASHLQLYRGSRSAYTAI